MKQKIKFCIIVLVIAVAIAFAAFTVLKYEVEGEKQVPFELGEIIVISSATVNDKENDTDNPAQNQEQTEEIQQTEQEEQAAEQTEQAIEQVAQPEQTEEAEQSSVNAEAQPQEENYVWEKNVIQTNDVYIYLDKNEEYKEEQIIKSVKIENIQILENVKVGKIQVYMPNSLNDSLYKYTNDFLVNSTLTYTGATVSNEKTLEIGNKGGYVCISFANVGLAQYKSNEDQEIEQGAYILEKMNLTDEDLKFKISFDLIIEVQGMSYKTNIVLNLPVDGVVGQKETHIDIKEFDNIVFKRL